MEGRKQGGAEEGRKGGEKRANEGVGGYWRMGRSEQSVEIDRRWGWKGGNQGERGGAEEERKGGERRKQASERGKWRVLRGGEE